MNKTTIEDIDYLFEQMALVKQGRNASLPSFLKPFHLACVAMKAKQANSNIELPCGSEAESYASRMGLWDAIDQKPPVSVPRRPSCGRFVEARGIACDQDVHNTSVEISEMFKNTGSDELTTETLQILASELLGNCCAHSDNGQVFGIATGQVWPGGNLAQLCIADCGQGIRQSLYNNSQLHKRLESENACKMSTEYGVTGKPFGSHSGYGLTLTNDLTKQNNGCLLIVSDKECYINTEGNVQTCTLPRGWDGTLIIFEWNTNIPLNITQVYDGWPTPAGFEEEEGEQYDDLFN
ncbi:hypothetical protein ACPV56_09410 [Vibrio astriarenae]